jgi:MFS transporter, MFS domain-containing protein family, molybdate-anion transporter
VGGLFAALLWKENVAQSSSNNNNNSNDNNKKPSIREAVDVVRSDPKIMLVGAVQSLFEAAMYIFVLQWPPAIAKAVVKAFGDGSATPYGTVFSCFMACCLLGSTLFGQLAKMGVATEVSTSVMLSAATVAMTAATFTVSASSSVISMSLAGLTAAFFTFEACVGMYFPSIGLLRSKYVPDSHRSVIMNLFGIPLNLLVVSVFLSTNKLGVKGALAVSSSALAIASLCMFKLRSVVSSGKIAN